jgi:hypothetical protein
MMNYGCEGGWMYDAYNYTSRAGISLKSGYTDYQGRLGKCKYDSSKTHFKNIGFVESDGLSNEKLKAIVAKQPVGVGMYAAGILSSYKSGVITEEFLKCSSAKKDVNHGVTIVGYGKV